MKNERFRNTGLPRMLVRIKCALLTLNKGQGEAKNAVSQRQKQWWGLGGLGGLGAKTWLHLQSVLLELEGCDWAHEHKY